MSKVLEIFVDGACSGNPGKAGIGVAINCQGKTVKEISKAIGDATNNIAEYSALVYALQEALVMKARELKVFTDSELMFRQVTGVYKVKNEKLKFLFDQVQHLMKGFDRVDISHVRREKNKHADKLATDAIKKKQAEVVAPLFESIGEESPSSKG
ncbi:MAG: ribonuclease HI family protein [Candidatus Omnitrophica bacterium]|nr:ribonuclease HI family protein [Candidatus Omnitrophota bacterium]